MKREKLEQLYCKLIAETEAEWKEHIDFKNKTLEDKNRLHFHVCDIMTEMRDQKKLRISASNLAAFILAVERQLPEFV